MATNATVLGLVVNPKLKCPVLVIAEGAGVDIHHLTEGWRVAGSGYYGDDDDRASRVTGYPRSHTPSGVKPKGMGYGTCLYTALCLGAHQNSEWHAGDRTRYQLSKYGPDGDGISSLEDDRSSEATDWWNSAKRLRLVREVEDETVDEDVDVTGDFDSTIEGSTYGDGTISRVNTINVDVVKTETADIYPWASATKANLVVADFTLPLEGRAPESAWKALQAGASEIEITVEVPWILALDVRGLSLDAINLLGILAQTAGASEEQLHGLRYRWETGLDPDADIRQMRLPFKPNSSEGRAARDLLAETQELRNVAGWASLEELP